MIERAGRMSAWFTPGRTVLVSLLWLLVVGVLLTYYPRYRDCGAPLLQADFAFEPTPPPQDSQGQFKLVDGDRGRCLLLQGGQDSGLRWIFPFEGGTRQLRLTCRIRTQDLVPDTAAHERAIISVYRIDGAGRPISAMPNYGFLTGTRPWTLVDEVLLVPAETRSLRVLVRNLGRSGEMFVDDLCLRPVCEHLDFRLLQLFVLASGFCLFGLWYRLLERSSRVQGALACLLLVVIVYGSICPRAQIVAISRGIDRVVAELNPKPQPPPRLRQNRVEPRPVPKLDTSTQEPIVEMKTSKKGHVLFYLLLAGTLGLWGIPSWRLLARVILAFAFLAAATEVLQIPEVGRTPSILDFAIDMAGVLVGLVLAWALRALSRLWQRTGAARTRL